MTLFHDIVQKRDTNNWIPCFIWKTWSTEKLRKNNDNLKLLLCTDIIDLGVTTTEITSPFELLFWDNLQNTLSMTHVREMCHAAMQCKESIERYAFSSIKKKVVFLTYNLKTEWLHFLHNILLIHISYALKIPVFGYQLTIHAMSVWPGKPYQLFSATIQKWPRTLWQQ